MKKILITTLVTASLAFAGGFVSLKTDKNVTNISNVKEVLNAKDDQKVKIKGYINKALDDEEYEFRDQKGDTIIIEIDDKVWGDVIANEETLLEIYGEVDSELIGKNKIDVKKLKIVE